MIEQCLAQVTCKADTGIGRKPLGHERKSHAGCRKNDQDPELLHKYGRIVSGDTVIDNVGNCNWNHQIHQCFQQLKKRRQHCLGTIRF